MISYKKLPGEFLLKNCLYLGKKNYLIRKDGGKKEVGKDYSGNVRLVILEKTCYFETLKTFPFSNIKDIRSAVEIDLPAFSPLKGNEFFIKKTGHKDEGATTVNLWFMDEQITERLSVLSPLFIIPESAFFSFSDRGAGRIYNISKNDQNNFFVFIDRNGGVQSMSSRGNEGDFRQFIRSIGAAAHDCPVTNMAGDSDYFSCLSDMVYNMSVKNALPFLNTAYISFDIHKRYVKTGTAVAASLLLLYLGISGAFPYLTYNRLLKEDKALSGNLSGLLKKQELIDHYYSRYKILADKINSYPCKTLLINHLRAVMPQDAHISRLTVSENVVEIRGSAVKASALLGALSHAEGIKSARFTAPIRKNKRSGMELFRIICNYE